MTDAIRYSEIKTNLLTIANHIHKEASHFRIKKLKNGQEILKKTHFICRLFLQSYYSSKNHVSRIEKLLQKNVQLASQIERAHYVEALSSEPTELFLAVQKYNETLSAAHTHPLLKSRSLANRIQLGVVKNTQVSELNPSKVLSVKDMQVPNDLQEDKPEINKERRLLGKYHVRRYPGDVIDHSKEAGRIFSSTQRERLLSGIGRVCEAVAGLFGFKVTTFQKYHYRTHQETDQQIYADPKTSPLNIGKNPTSYWLGHATLFLSIPLKSEKGTLTSFNVITDPVEGDLHALLYPRQTKFARSLDETPAPHVYLLSHNHLDHYNKESVKKIFAQQPVMIVPKGDRERYAKLAKELGFDSSNIYALDWWEKKEIQFEKNGEQFRMQITATPARHWSGQGPCGGHESTFLGYVIQGNEEGDIYFAGDTARLNDDHIAKLKDHFNIRWNFQPGGPDEVRKDMESTHQASVDGLWMHTKMMLLKIYQNGMHKEDFLKDSTTLKTIYMHTMTFKLGNLHLSDTKDSLEKVLDALDSYDETQLKIREIEKQVENQMTLLHKKLSTKKLTLDQVTAQVARKKNKLLNKKIEKELGLKTYEKQVYDELVQFAENLEFAQDQRLHPKELSQLLRSTVIVPKIGSRTDLTAMKADQSQNLFF